MNHKFKVGDEVIYEYPRHDVKLTGTIFKIEPSGSHTKYWIKWHHKEKDTYITLPYEGVTLTKMSKLHKALN